MADETTPSPVSNRRSSLGGQTLADLFGPGRSTTTQRSSLDNSTNNSPPPSYPGPISQAAAQAHARRISITTMPTFRGLRRDSISSANSGSFDESAIEDDAAPRDPASGSTPITPFGIGRRMSFGARALRDVRNLSGSSGGGGGGGVDQNGSAEFWNENMRTRAERTSSIGGPSQPMQIPAPHSRAKSVATMEPPVQEMPVPKLSRKPDIYQERILRGDFHMD